MDLQQIIKEVVPGSIWLRTDGSRARVLAVTNLSLSPERQEKYVPVVVYVGPSGKVFSRPLRDFAGYFPTWIGFDRAVEKAIESVTVPLDGSVKQEAPANTEPDLIDMSTDAPVAIAAPKKPKPTVQVRAKSEGVPVQTPPSLLKAAFKIGEDANAKTPAVTAEQLSQALRVYSQVPDEHLGLVVHKLSFELSPKLTIDMLKEVFQPDAQVNTVDMFRIGTPVSDETVGIDAYIGVYPEFSRNVLYGTVYIGADMPSAAPTLEAHTHVEESTGSIESPAQEDEPTENPAEVAPTAEEPAKDQTAPDDAIQSAEKETAPVEDITPAEDGQKESAAPVTPAKKPRKKREPKKKVAPVIISDDEIDVENLS